MQRTLGRVVGAFTTAAMVSAVGIAGVSHQRVETGIKGHMAYTTWSDYEGSAGSAQYSALTQINKSNVAQLQQVWFYPAGNNGGGNWGGGAVDPPTGTLYIEAKNAPSMIRLEPNPPKRQMTGSPETEGRILYIQNCQSCHTAELTGQPPSIPSLVDVVSRIGADRAKSTVQNGPHLCPPSPASPTKKSMRWSLIFGTVQDTCTAGHPCVPLRSASSTARLLRRELPLRVTGPVTDT